ncbi:sensor domain-containing diguanylate cyclase [Hydrogenoanaerobacterium sp.]|uniref:sensor domain-containing protein n=1 Tax=Hydrogenoanaerobacterium sp. TaxID=2953763 RepID=UPI00289BD60B|nr:sensor domain-containing diguanylate cyclase [Hydrogenoanaerobacterium sp.]
MLEKTNKFFCYENIYDAMLEGYALFAILRDENNQPCDYQFLEVNKQFEVLTGILRSETIEKTLKQVLNVSDENWVNIHNSLQKEEGIVQFEYCFEISNRYFQVSAFHPSNETVITLFLETTAQKKTEEALKIHRILFENAQDIILYINLEGQIVDSNQRAQEKYGYTKEQLLSKKIQDIRHPSMIADYKEQMQQAEIKGIVFEGLHVRSDGSSFPVEVSARGVNTEQGPLRIHIIRDITKRKEQEAKITWLARYDALTSIQNRGSLIMQLEQEIQRSVRNGAQFAVMLFDIDRFKYINDHYGHEAGDVVLRHVATKVQKVLRATDQIGRLGGDEFVVLQTDVKELDDAIQLVKRIHTAAAEPITYNGTPISVSISAGISQFPGDAKDTDSLLFRADKAMYVAKNSGGGGYSFFTLGGISFIGN